jgi:hypothetical protein
VKSSGANSLLFGSGRTERERDGAGLREDISLFSKKKEKKNLKRRRSHVAYFWA